MEPPAVTVFTRAGVALMCATAVVVSGCGYEVEGQSPTSGTSSSTSGPPPGAAPPAAPPVNAVVDYQIGGEYPPAAEVGVVIRDRSADPVAGIYSICYVNAFQAQPDEASVWTGPEADLVLRTADGVPVEDDGWDEPLLDISTADKRERLARIVDGWMADCAERGFRAVEPDNLDSWTRSGGRLTRGHAVEYAALVVRAAHARGLAAAQKNAAELTDEEIRRIGFDFAIAEECQQYSWNEGSECDRYMAVHGDRVIEIEYTDGPGRAFSEACRERGDRISVLLRDREVVAAGLHGHVSRSC